MYFNQKPLLRRLKESFTDREDLKTPLLKKEAKSAEAIIKKLQEDSLITNDEKVKEKLENDIKLHTIGLRGENMVLFELTNSFLPLHILHDLHIQHGELKAQYDFVVLTRKFLLVIEVKNYYGDIEVNEKGEFIRNVKKGQKVIFKEGFYSPLRQAERQTEILRSYMQHHQVINKLPIKSVVVFTNKKTIIHAQKAKKEIQSKILRADNLVAFLKNELKSPSPVFLMDNRMTEISNFLLNSHSELIEVAPDSLESKFLEDKENPALEKSKISREQLENTLKEFRKEKANLLGVKAFYIFSNKTLEHLLEVQPTTLNDLLNVNGIGKTKLEEFGEELITIFKENK